MRAALRILRMLTYIAGSWLFLLAVLAILAWRLLLPQLMHHPDAIRTLLSSNLERPVHFDGFSLDWRGWRLAAILDNVTIADPDVQVHRLSIELAGLSSLIRRRPVIRRVHVSELEVELGFLDEQFLRGRTPWSDWLLNLKEIIVQNARIRWRRGNGAGLPYVWIESLQMQQRFDRVRLAGRILLPPDHGGVAEIYMNARLDDWVAGKAVQFYASARDLTLERWLALLDPNPLQTVTGQVDLRFWGDWSAGSLSSFQARTAGELRIGTGQNAIRFPHLEAEWAGRLHADGYRYLGVRVNRWETDTEHWPGNELRLATDGDGLEWHARADFLPLSLVRKLLPAIPFAPFETAEALLRTSTEGELRHLQLSLRRDSQGMNLDHLDMEFVEVGLEGHPRLAKLKGLNGNIYLHLNEGWAQLQASRLSAELPELFGVPLNLDTPSAILYWEQIGERLRLEILPLEATVQNMQLQIRGETEWLQGQPDRIGAWLEVRQAPLATLLALQPLTLRDDLHHALEETISSGTVRRGEILLQGRPEDFPYTNRKGRFAMRMQLEDAHLTPPQWPGISLQDVGMELKLNETALEAAIEEGEWTGVDVAGSRLHTLELGARPIIVEPQLHGEIQDMQNLLTSLLERNLPWRWAAGTATLAATLSVPTDGGRIRVRSASLQLNDGAFLRDDGQQQWFSGLTGELKLEEENHVVGQGLAALYGSYPARLEAEYRHGDPPQWQIDASGSADAGQLVEELRWLRSPITQKIAASLETRVAGHTDWRSSWSSRNGGQQEIELSLEGIGIELPEPFGKTAAEPRVLRIVDSKDVTGSRQTQYDYGGILEASYMKVHGHGANGRLRVGGRIPALSIADWSVALSSGGDRSETFSPLNAIGLEIDLDVETLELFGRRYPHTRLRADLENGAGTINLEGDELRGKVLVADSWELELDRLWLPNDDSPPDIARPSIDPHLFPSFSAKIDRLYRDDQALGEFQVTARSTENGLALNSLSLKGDAFEIGGSGRWDGTAASARSNVDLEIEGQRLSELLELLGVGDSAIDSERIQVYANLRWPGSPMDYTLKDAEGELHLDIGKGRMGNVNPGISQVFGLLNAQMLLRRLTLDFKDLGGEEMIFDAIEGILELQEGNLYTENLIINTPSLDIYIEGRSGLVQRDYDQIISAVPQVSKALPWLGIILGPPGIGIGIAAGWLEENLIGQTRHINQALERRYRLTGTWDDPILIPIQLTETQTQSEKQGAFPSGRSEVEEDE